MATVSLGGRLEDKLSALAAAGFDGVELLAEDVKHSAMTPAECALRCADLGVAVDLYQPFRRAEGVSEEEFVTVMERFRREMDVMDHLGAKAILVVSNTDVDAVPSLEVSADQLRRLGQAAQERGKTVVFEALGWGTHVSSTATAWDVVHAAAHPCLRLAVDTFHLFSRGESAALLHRLNVDDVGFFQIADAPPVSGPLAQWSRTRRCFPGEGSMDLVPAVTALLQRGYSGPVSLEIFNPGYTAGDPEEMARRGAQSLQELYHQALQKTAATYEPGPGVLTEGRWNSHGTLEDHLVQWEVSA